MGLGSASFLKALRTTPRWCSACHRISRSNGREVTARQQYVDTHTLTPTSRLRRSRRSWSGQTSSATASGKYAMSHSTGPTQTASKSR